MSEADSASSSIYGVQGATRLLSCLNADNATLCAAGPRRLYMVKLYNAATTVRYLKLYDKATAPLSTDTPKFTFALRPSLDFDPNIPGPGLTFFNGIGFRITNLPADADATFPTAADIVGLNLAWQ